VIQGIDNIGICVHDLTRSVQFYETLGFKQTFANDRGVTLTLGGLKLFVFPTRQAAPPAVAREFTLFDNPPGIDHLSFQVDDVDAMYAELTRKGLTFGVAPADQAWGARIAALKDPDGNNVYLLKWLARH
jgi:catechol 2,3-dioxygenase-like lactoylglutathione lyase family enzyme